jgi:hypothetical protein
MSTLLRTTLLGTMLSVAGLVGCSAAFPGCSDEETKSLAIQVVGQKLLTQRLYGDDLLESRRKELEDQTLILDGITTLQRATPERPQALCEARVLIDLFDVGRNYDLLKAAPSQSTSEEMQDRLAAFERDPSNLQRLGERRRMELKISYSTSYTDDGETTVRVQAH